MNYETKEEFEYFECGEETAIGGRNSNECNKCGKELNKKNSEKCQGCGKIFCLKHVYSRVDESNSSITNNSPLYCEDCYYKHYGKN